MPEMRQMGKGGCQNRNASALLKGSYVMGELEDVKASCLADARCKVMVYHTSGSGLHAFCERDPNRLADVWLKVEGSRAGLNLCENLGGCTWSGGPCQTGPGTCDASTGRCSSTGLVADGTPCDDGDLFTSDDRCAHGGCAGHERNCLKTPCPASSACVTNSCVNPVLFSQPSFCAISYNRGVSCDDGDAATPSSVCDDKGTCIAKQVAQMTLTSLTGCRSNSDAACKPYGTRYGDIPGCFAACGTDPNCLFVQTQVGFGGDCSLYNKCCSPGTRTGQVYKKPS
jgi:hypothetical protein